MGKFYHVHGFKNSQTLSDGGNSNVLEGFGVDHAKDITGYSVFCERLLERSPPMPTIHTFNLTFILRVAEIC